MQHRALPHGKEQGPLPTPTDPALFSFTRQPQAPIAPKTSAPGSPKQERPSQAGTARGQLMPHGPFPWSLSPLAHNPTLRPRVLCPRPLRSSSSHPFPGQRVGTIIGAPFCAVSSVQLGPPAQSRGDLQVGQWAVGGGWPTGRPREPHSPPCTGLAPRSHLLLGRLLRSPQV